MASKRFRRECRCWVVFKRPKKDRVRALSRDPAKPARFAVVSCRFDFGQHGLDYGSRRDTGVGRDDDDGQLRHTPTFSRRERARALQKKVPRKKRAQEMP